MATMTDPTVEAPTETAQDHTAENQRITPASNTSETDQVVRAESLRSVVADELIRPVMTNDHVVVGRLFVATSLIFALGAAVLGALLRWERLDAAGVDVFGGLNSWYQMWTLHRVSLMLLVLAPLLMGLAMAVVPDQIKANGLAFPRAALASFWGWLIGSAIILASVFGGGGWGALDVVRPSESDAMALTLLGTALTICSLLLGALVVATTIISLRAPGMSLSDTPPFAWSMLVSAVVWLLTLPVALANIMLIYADLRGRKPISFGTPEGIGIWNQLDWITEQPAVYALAVPVLGIAAETIRTITGGKLRHPALLTAAIGLFGLLSTGGWQQVYFSDTGGSDPRYGLVYVVSAGLAGMLLVVTATTRTLEALLIAPRSRGVKPLTGLLSTHMAGALAGLALLTGAVVSGALRVIEPFELLESSTNSGIFNAVMLSGITAAAAGLWHWSPLLFGSGCVEWLGRISVSLLFIGAMLLSGADVVAGFQGTDDFPSISALYDGSQSAILETIASSGSLLVASGILALSAAMLLAFQVQALDALAKSRK